MSTCNDFTTLDADYWEENNTALLSEEECQEEEGNLNIFFIAS